MEEAGRVSLVAVTRAGVPRLDARDLVGQEGDVLHLAVLDDARRALDDKLSAEGSRGGDGPVAGK